MDNQKLANLLLRIGIASAFFYAAISSFIEPFNWIGYFPTFLRDIVPQQLLLTGFSLLELFVGVWLLSGKHTFYAGLLSAAMLMGIVVFNLGQLDVIFRDVAIIFAALALAAATHKRN